MESLDDIGKRENWKSRAALYSSGAKIASQKCEDLVARRILAGLGYTEKGINKLEAALDLPYDPSKPLYDRTVECLRCVSNGMFSSDKATRRFALACREVDDKHNTVLKDLETWYSLAESERSGAVLLGRVGKEKLAWGYVILRDGDLPVWILQHPSILVRRSDGWWIWCREVCDLVYDMAKFEHWEVPGVVFDA